MATETEKLLAGIESLFKRPLTEDEVESAVLWRNCQDLSHFVEGFPQDWKLMKEMLLTYLGDYEAQWVQATNREPGKVGDLDVMHAQVYGAKKIITSFIQDVENAPETSKQVPDVMKEAFRELQATPQE